MQALFDAVDGRVEQIRARRRKGVLTALRDSALLKTIYAFGLRRAEAQGLDLVDLRHNPKIGEYGRCGALFIRHGKSANGAPAKRRTVLTVPEMDWIVAVLNHWLDEVRPMLAPGQHPALWVTERCSRVSLRCINDAFDAARADAGLSTELDLHSLRHLRDPPGRVRLPRAVRVRSGRARLRQYHGDLYGGVRRVPQPLGPTGDAPPPPRSVGREVIKKMGYEWHLRLRMAEKGTYATSDLVPLLAERGVHLSREQVFRLVTQPPQRLSMDTLAALCDILSCTPNDLIEVTTVQATIRKAAGAAVPGPPPPARRTTVRRPRAVD